MKNRQSVFSFERSDDYSFPTTVQRELKEETIKIKLNINEAKDLKSVQLGRKSCVHLIISEIFDIKKAEPT